ncbi:hypothetical protein DXG03_009767 [Asterophora parasitica]|uniref:Uncharacterized protein n=1 Tax=Asterophora parasitica TaxID=117018 RepID=A0A9P7K7Q2_9AGAR|nr:hypothetical protein DXG03_009767 [Asterophora parasitica]
MASIDERLSLVEDNFLLAAVEGGPSLVAFHDNWLVLLEDIDHAARTANITEETLTTADVVSSRIAFLTDQIMDFKSSSDALKDDLEDVFAQFDINDNSRVASSSRAVSENIPSLPELPNYTTNSSHPSYIEPAYQWLLNNIHNPYPSKEARIAIAREVNSDAKSIDSWFIYARKRMGWNTLRKKHFANKRVDIVDAATRFFVQEDPRRPLDPTVELEFAGIKKCAKDLYADRFERSTLASKLDIAVKDLTPATQAQAREERERRRQEARQREEDALAASAYPSPHRSPHRSPEHIGVVPLEQDEDLATTHPEGIAGRKRRSLSPVEDDNSVDRSHKRTTLRTPLSTTGLPSPTPSSHQLLHRSPTPPPATDSTPLPIISRKRRLSDAGGQGVPKRPKNLPAGPRMQAVSDPLPMSGPSFEASSINDWFNAHFGILSPVVVDPLDTCDALDVEVFNYPPVDGDTSSSASQPLPQSSSLESADLAVPALVADDSPFTQELDISTNTFDIDDLFLDYEEPETQFSGQDPASTYNWFYNPSSFDSSHNQFNTANVLQGYGHVLPQVPSLIFEGHMSTVPAKTTVEAEDKAEIQQQLADMKEAMRRLEEKLAASS